MKTDRKGDVIVGVIMLIICFCCVLIGYLADPDMSNWKFAYSMAGASMAMALECFQKKERHEENPHNLSS